MKLEATTRDTLWRGQVVLAQPGSGFRSSLDPVLLASFLAPPYGHVLDLGAGTGALALLLAARDARAKLTAIELQPRLAALACRSVELSQRGDRVQVVEGDARDLRLLRAAAFDLVATNPPFRPLGRQPASADSERAIANAEVALSLPECLDACARAVRPGGRVGIVYPAERASELLAGLEQRGVLPARLRVVYPRAGAKAGRVLVEARRGRKRPSLAILPPLILHDGRGYTPEAKRWVEGVFE